MGKKAVGYAGMIFILLLIGLPLYWTLSGSLKTHPEIYTNPVTWYPHQMHPQNYDEATQRVPFGITYETRSSSRSFCAQ